MKKFFMLLMATCCVTTLVSAQTAPLAGWTQSVINEAVEACVSTISDNARQEVQAEASRRGKALGSGFTRELNEVAPKIQKTCSCLINQMTHRWTPEELPENASEVNAFVESQFQKGMCLLPGMAGN